MGVRVEQRVLPVGYDPVEGHEISVATQTDPQTARAEIVALGIMQLITELRSGQRFTHQLVAKLKRQDENGGKVQEKVTEAFGNYRKYAAHKQEQIEYRSLRAGGFVLAIPEKDSSDISLVEVNYCVFDPWDGGQLIGMPGAVVFELDHIVDIRGWEADHIEHPELPLNKDQAFYSDFYA